MKKLLFLLSFGAVATMNAQNEAPLPLPLHKTPSLRTSIRPTLQPSSRAIRCTCTLAWTLQGTKADIACMSGLCLPPPI